MDLQKLKEVRALIENPPVWTSNIHHLFISASMKVLAFTDTHPSLWDDSINPLNSEGIPYKWLSQYELNTSDIHVGRTDSDDDGFTVYEEWVAGTNPKDSSSKPDVAYKLRIKESVKRTFPFVFDGVQVSGGEKKFTIHRYDDRSKTYFPKEGDVIPDKNYPGYKVVQYEEKFGSLLDPTIRDSEGKPVSREVDVSELTLQKEEDPPIILIKGKNMTTKDLRAKLYFALEDRFFEVEQNTTFILQDIQYQVIRISLDVGDRIEVAVRRSDTNKEYDLQMLKDEDIKRPTIQNAQ